MANNCEAVMVTAIIALHRKGWSKSRIARELKIDRGAVARHIRLSATEADVSKPSISTSGLSGSENSKPSISTPGSEANPAISTTGAEAPPAIPIAGRKSDCEEFRQRIEEKHRSGLSAQRIYQDLVVENGFSGSYQSVKRFVRRFMTGAGELPFRRMEELPGKEMQVDFGRGAAVTDGVGRKRCPHLFRTVLSHSRKGYSEVVFRQTTEDFIRVLENAFRSYGGVTETVVVDNLKAAVIHADWFDPELNPKIKSFCAHYGTVILPTRPGIPRHKGKIERAVGYAQGNALKGKTFMTLAEQNAYLSHWEGSIADTRIHGTTREQVRTAFERERPFLRPLAAMLFPCFKECRRSVHRDGHIEFEKSYYSVPYEYSRREVIVRAETRIVRIYSATMDEIAVHAKVEPGKFSTQGGHIPKEKKSEAEKGTLWLVRRASLIGPNCGKWAEGVVRNRGVQSVRTLQGLLFLARRHGSRIIDKGCRKAMALEMFHLRNVRGLMGGEEEQEQFEFKQEHPLIRDLGVYGEIATFHDSSEIRIEENSQV